MTGYVCALCRFLGVCTHVRWLQCIKKHGRHRGGLVIIADMLLVRITFEIA